MTDRIRRVFVPATPHLAERVVLDPDESHHVARVLRLKAGDAVAVFDGRGGEWDATIDELTKERVSVVVGAERPGAVEPNRTSRAGRLDALCRRVGRACTSLTPASCTSSAT